MDKGRWRAAAFRPLIGSSDGTRTKRDLYCNTPALTRAPRFLGLMCRTAQFSHLLHEARGIWDTFKPECDRDFKFSSTQKTGITCNRETYVLIKAFLLMVTFIKIYLIQYSTLSYSCGYDIISSLIYENHLFKLLINILCEQDMVNIIHK